MKFESTLIIAIILLAVVFAVLEFMHIIVIKWGRTMKIRRSLVACALIALLALAAGAARLQKSCV